MFWPKCRKNTWFFSDPPREHGLIALMPFIFVDLQCASKRPEIPNL